MGAPALSVLAPSTRAALRETNHRIVITGAGGWLGLATLDLLAEALGDEFAGRVRCFGASARTLQLAGRSVAQAPLKDIGTLPPAPTIVLHLAFLTKDRAEAMDEATYQAANRALSQTTLAALDAIGATGIFVASSGAAYKADDPAAAPAMQLYGALKRADETLFEQWAAAAGATSVVARIFNIAGRYINKHDRYALAAFINDALAGRPIAVTAPHAVIRGTVAICELMSLVLLLLLHGGPQNYRFDTGGAALELGELAEVVGRTLDGGPVRRAPITSDRTDRYVGDRAEYDRLRAEWQVAGVPLATAITETANSIIAMRDGSA